MAAFSIGEAVGSGFRVIRENPKAVLMWGLAYFVVTLGPMLAVVAAMAPDFIKLSKLPPVETTTDAATIEAFAVLQAKMMLLQAVQFISTIVGAAILYSAVFRAVLEPQDKGRWYLRLGRQEIWLAFVWMVAMALVVMAMFVGMIPLSVAGIVIAAMTNGEALVSWIVLAGIGFCLVGLVLWAYIRLSLAFPMTFAERKFQMFESWSLTRGHAGRMTLTFLAVSGLASLIQLIVLALFIVLGSTVLALSGVTIPWNQGPDAQMTGPSGGWALFLLVAIPCAALMFSIVSAGLQTISIAPLAYIYRQLRPAEASA